MKVGKLDHSKDICEYVITEKGVVVINPCSTESADS